ncbi:hypothetical protein BP6252_01748 [Coleophoma cylindrospora]|uniref:DUF8004 domain-containing protein n=1 Tax=Coleophoma cylindrospora TaxID=1849047 RepID=A0A3D8STU4_9HELO|nr:hypothetical protein BP6252_01748 [Coleophoma cylindrospora]
MSGRSAHVRKEKTKVKDSDAITIREEAPIKSPPPALPASAIANFPLPGIEGRPTQFAHDIQYQNHSYGQQSSAKSIASSKSDERPTRLHDDLAYARVRKPQLPALDVSGIEKSSFRSMMDKKSENVRGRLAKTFGKKKRDDDAELRPPTSATVRPDDQTPLELDAGYYDNIPPIATRPKMHTQPSFDQLSQSPRPGPPQTSLPPIPQGPQLKRWNGSGRAPQPWNKLRKDPELWDPNGDTLVYFGHESQQPRQQPSFRLSSHILEGTESRFLVTLLREGATDDMSAFNIPSSPISSPSTRAAMPFARLQRGMPTPPMSENGASTYDGQVSYEIYFQTPPHLSKSDSIRHQVTTRNVFAILYGASLVGMNLFQALNDLHERLESWMPSDSENSTLIIDYIASRGIDDVRNDPATAASLLAWSESQGIRWEEGWREAYIHCSGMYNRLELLPDYRYITPISRALLERSSLEVQVRVQSSEDRFSEFDFNDMWPIMTSPPPPARGSFERLRNFFVQHYQASYGSWPPSIQPGDDQWLSRGVAQRLQKDFGALYDYLVNREVVWDCTEASSGRKWNIANPGNKAFDADTSDLPMTDILVAFDNRHKYPHIPHPYPLVPESIPIKTSSRENLFKASKKPLPREDKITERRAALAYTESTNIYLLGSDFVTNDLVDAFVRFEKSDKPAEVDPYAARRGRWVLIYGILQTLATVAVDTPNMRYNSEVNYHLSPRLRGTPPWRGANQNNVEAGHENSHCWTVPRIWNGEDSPTVSIAAPTTSRSNLSRRQTLVSDRSSTAVSTTDSDAGSSIRQGRFSNGSKTGRRKGGSRDHSEKDYSYANYVPGIEKVEEWPIREETRDMRASPVIIRDFDEYDF